MGRMLCSVCWLSILAILHGLWRYWFRRSRTLLSSLCTKGQSTWRKVQRNQFNLFWIAHSAIIIISSRKNFFPFRDMDRVLNTWFLIWIWFWMHEADPSFASKKCFRWSRIYFPYIFKNCTNGWTILSFWSFFSNFSHMLGRWLVQALQDFARFAGQPRK